MNINHITRHALESEKSIERYLVNRVRELGGLALKFNSQTAAGFPDRIVLLPGGTVVWCELKSKGKKPRLIQVQAQERLKAIQQAVYTCDSREQVDEMLNKITL